MVSLAVLVEARMIGPWLIASLYSDQVYCKTLQVLESSKNGDKSVNVAGSFPN